MSQRPSDDYEYRRDGTMRLGSQVRECLDRNRRDLRSMFAFGEAWRANREAWRQMWSRR